MNENIVNGIYSGIISGVIVAICQGIVSHFIKYNNDLKEYKNYLYKLCRTIELNVDNIPAVVSVLAEEPIRIVGRFGTSRNKNLKKVYKIIDEIDSYIGDDIDIINLQTVCKHLDEVRIKL